MKALRIILMALTVACTASFGMCADYIIDIGDVLHVHVWGEKELDVQTNVRPDGKITLPGVGDVDAAGNTTVQLQERIAETLGTIVRDPMVTVSVSTSHNNAVVVHGAGVKPGVVPLEGRTTLLQLLTRIAPESTADLDAATLTRNGTVMMTGFRDLYERGATAADMNLMGGDRIFVPFREKWNVYVIGAVEKPMAIPHHEGMTMLEAVLAAGGFTRFADRNQTEIVRDTKGQRQVMRVRAGDLIDKGDLGENRLLMPGDYVIAKKGLF
ncbi:polysaccharide biosynthesis/export family protein [Nitratidesulfovibrio sp.]|uniref:polysaccharide biosynthesis/export family protein n=1 Tax=Nitratidesulfovibrio sp. TaxID=2802297 RepID=UPI00334210F0